MKVTDLRRKLLAALAAGGMLAPGALRAAELNVNLVVNGGFENVDLGTVGAYDAPLILNWSGTQGFAYSHQPGVTGIPDYADGADPPSAGNWYFTSNNAVPDISGPGQFFQVIDVSTGATGAAISAGTAGFTMSAYMSSYLNDNDFGNIHAEFRNSIGTSLGTAMFSDSDPGPNNVWSLVTGGGSIPVGTATVRLSVYGTPVNSGPDGYIDNVDFRVANVLSALAITVNRDTGALTLSNQTGGVVALASYSITSEFQALQPSNWLSIADNYDAGNPGPNQVDATHQWSELTDPMTHGDLSEADLDAGVGSTLANGRVVNLSNANAWIRSHNEDLVFQYISGGEVKQGIVAYTGNGGEPFARGDLNTDGAINAADWMVFRTSQHTSLGGLSPAEAYRRGDLTGDLQNNHADFAAFKSLYDEANGSGSFAAMLQGVPEPSGIIILISAGLLMCPATRRRPGGE